MDITTKKVNVYRGNGFMTISKYNKSGNLLFIADKDSKTITVVDTNSKIILGNYTGHNGVIWYLDVCDDSKTMISLSGDMSIIKWNLTTATYKKIMVKSIPKYINIFKNVYVVSFDPISKKSVSSFQIFNLETDELLYNYEEENNQKKITTINFLEDNILLITYDNGFYGIFDTDSTSFTKLEKLHENSIKSVSFNKDRTKLITSSIDCTCKIINLSDYKCEIVIENIIENIVPCNYAVFSPLRNYVIVGGGIDAMLVSQKSNNDFTARFYSVKSGKFISGIGGHFGPIRYISFHPDGKCFTTASQDGIVRLNYIDDDIPSTTTETLKFINDINLPLEYEESKQIIKQDIKQHIKQEEKKESKLYTFASRTKYFEREPEKRDTFAIKISNLPPDIEYNDLTELFEFFGRIKERGITIKKYNDDTVAFVNYLDKSCAEKAFSNMNGYRMGYQIIKIEVLNN
jgi:translation initiation factor 3 subunit I